MTQVQFQMKTFLDSVQETMEANQLELQENIEKIDDESEGLQFVIKSCANLSNSLQAVLFDLDAFERTLWNRMEKTVVKFDLKSNNFSDISKKLQIFPKKIMILHDFRQWRQSSISSPSACSPPISLHQCC